MLITPSQPGLEEALTQLGALRADTSASKVRIGLVDGEVFEGSLVSTSPDHIAVSVAGSPVVRRVSAADIQSLELAVPRRGREWALAGIGIVAATAAVGGMVLLPGIGSYLQLHAVVGFKVIFFLGVGLLTLLLAKTGLREWLTQWRTMYRLDDA